MNIHFLFTDPYFTDKRMRNTKKYWSLQTHKKKKNRQIYVTQLLTPRCHQNAKVHPRKNILLGARNYPKTPLLITVFDRKTTEDNPVRFIFYGYNASIFVFPFP